ncbi:MAG: peptidoglycan-associated lipoprotein [Sulfurimonas sp.]|nr:MAG: peptidoglycan-associated lipoprotein [Sulfurimonas sp.]
MKNVLMVSAVAALLVLSGCSSKDSSIEPYDNSGITIEPDASSNTDTEELHGEEIVVVEGADANEMTLSALESRLKSVNFAFDRFNLSSEMQDIVDTNAQVVKSDAKSYAVKLEGNCDEWGSDEYNYALGLKRANTVKSAMIRDGVSAERITMVSYGESNPICTDKTEACWAQNRRVDFKLLP